MLFTSIWVWVNSVLWPSYEQNAPITGGNLTHLGEGFHLIGAGLSRTGTLSTRIALATLLGGKVYHGFVSTLDDEHDFW